MKVLTVIGARPQFIKASVVSMAFAKNASIEEVIVHTGQHYDENMSDIFFDEMQIPKPVYNLHIGNLTHGAMTGRMIEKIEELINTIAPDYLLVYGDTNSTMAGAIAASKTKAKLAHVEAGLRSFNMKMPEEINRIVTDRLSDILFCPTNVAKNNLVKEGFKNYITKTGSHMRIEIVGDVMQETATYFSEYAEEKCSELIRNIIRNDFVLCTLHRPENLNDAQRLESIFAALNEIGETFTVVLPLHPGTRKMLKKFDINMGENIRIIDPVGFLDMLTLLKYAKCIFTDSGGLQKEAYFFRKPCITLRDETEWVELVENGYNKLAGADAGLIKKYFAESGNIDFTEVTPLYGDGNASDKIVKILVNDFESN